MRPSDPRPLLLTEAQIIEPMRADAVRRFGRRKFARQVLAAIGCAVAIVIVAQAAFGALLSMLGGR